MDGDFVGLPPVVVHAPSDKSLQKKFTLHANSSTDSASSSSQSTTDERRRHALDELVDSEHAYVADLRTLVDVYLARIPALLPALDGPLVARNADELLAFHDAFAATLADAAAAEPVGYAIRAVARAFTQQAAGFALYDVFCHGHLAAADALRKQESRAEYATFERTCAVLANPPVPPLLVHAATAPATQREHRDAHPPRTNSSSRLSILGRPRRHSLPSAEAAAFARGHAHSASGSSSASQTAPSLHFADLLIKPVQRICRYQLLLAQLVSPKSDHDDALQSAIQTMRDAAAAADDASQRADAAYRSQLIRTRIGMSASSAPIFAPKEEVLPAAFLDSLGVVRFAGSLDVVQYGLPGPGHEPKRRHLGLFVYDGGYVVMVKVLRGRVYEPKHWFAIGPGCTVEERAEEFAFQISTPGGHRFECFAAGEREQALWLAQLSEARAVPGHWSPGDELRYSSLHSAAPSAGPSSAMASPEQNTVPLPDDVLNPTTPVAPGPPKRTLTMGSMSKRHSLPMSMSGSTRAERGLDDVLSSAYAQARHHARLSTHHNNTPPSASSHGHNTPGRTMSRAASERGIVRKRPSASRLGGLGPQLDTLFAAAPTPPVEDPDAEDESGYEWDVVRPGGEGHARNSPAATKPKRSKSLRALFVPRERARSAEPPMPVVASPSRSLFSRAGGSEASFGSAGGRWWASLRRRVQSSPGLPLFGSGSASTSMLTAEPPVQMSPRKSKSVANTPASEGRHALELLRSSSLSLPALTRGHGRQRPKMPSPSPSVSSSEPAATPGTDETPPPLPRLRHVQRSPDPPTPAQRQPKPLVRGLSILGSLRGMTPLSA